MSGFLYGSCLIKISILFTGVKEPLYNHTASKPKLTSTDFSLLSSLIITKPQVTTWFAKCTCSIRTRRDHPPTLWPSSSLSSWTSKTMDWSKIVTAMTNKKNSTNNKKKWRCRHFFFKQQHKRCKMLKTISIKLKDLAQTIHLKAITVNSIFQNNPFMNTHASSVTIIIIIHFQLFEKKMSTCTLFWVQSHWKHVC